MNDKHKIPEELLREWQQLPESEVRELVRTWDFAGGAHPTDPDPDEIAAGEERLLKAIERRPRSLLRIAAAFAVLVAAAGLLYLVLQEPPPSTAADEFMLILHGEPLLRYPEEEHAAIIGEYIAWARELSEGGRFVTGNELAPGGRVLRAEGDSISIERVEPSEQALSGFFIITAADLDEAARIAADCPHLTYGGRVEVRRIGSN